MALFAAGYPATSQSQATDRELNNFLEAYVDTLLPRDETPSGAELNVQGTLLERAARDVQYQSLLYEGLRWFDNTSLNLRGDPFAISSDEVRAAVVSRAEQTGAGQLPWIFFTITRADAFQAFYAQPESWPGLGLVRPPQPFGYIEHNKPPNESDDPW